MSGRFLHDVPSGRWTGTRDEAILEFARGKRILHVGCTDSPFTEEKYAQRDLLHEKLISVADDVVGLDIDAPGLAFLAAHLGGRYVHGDISESATVHELPVTLDLVIATDVLEHVPNEAAFLGGLTKVAQQSGARVLLTTPNALALRNVFYTAFRRQVMHPDHRRVHTPRTLQYSLQRSTLAVDEWVYYSIASGQSWPRRASDAICRVATRFRRGYGDGLLVVARAADLPKSSANPEVK